MPNRPVRPLPVADVEAAVAEVEAVAAAVAATLVCPRLPRRPCRVSVRFALQGLAIAVATRRRVPLTVAALGVRARPAEPGAWMDDDLMDDDDDLAAWCMDMDLDAVTLLNPCVERHDACERVRIPRESVAWLLTISPALGWLGNVDSQPTTLLRASGAPPPVAPVGDGPARMADGGATVGDASGYTTRAAHGGDVEGV